MKYIPYGVTREVFLTQHYAIKIPKLRYGWKLFLNGLLANMQERQFGTLGWPELCPVVFSLPGGWLVVQRRAAPLTDHEWVTFSARLRLHLSRVAVFVEHKRCSFGVLDGRIVAIDYGS